MTEIQNEINDLFSMFHDFEIKELSFENNVIQMTIQIPWGELWNDWEYSIQMELSGCEFILCDYSEILNTPDNLAKNRVDRLYIDKSTSDPKLIDAIGLEIQSHQFSEPNKYLFLCNSSKEYAFGKLAFTADNYKIFNKEGNQIVLQQMKSWSEEWWENISN